MSTKFVYVHGRRRRIFEDGVECKKGDGRHMTVFVDADACPVKDEIFSFARQYNVQSVFVSSYNHFSHVAEMEWVYVDTEREAVDLYIVNHAQKGDVVITHDIGLASLLVNRDICVMSPQGKMYSEDGIGHVLYIRYLHAKQRRQGVRMKGMKRFSDEERQTFRKSFEKILSKSAGNKA